MLSLLIISQELNSSYQKAVKSVEALHPQVLSDTSTDPLGVRKYRLIRRAKTEWVLLLDTDEIASPKLVTEIQHILKTSPNDVHGYEIPYQNYVFGKPVYYGGERYSKVRLFRRKYGAVTPVPIHEEVVVTGGIGKLTGVIHHYSYRSIWQVLSKFTRYAWLVSAEKRTANEPVSIKKLFLYGPHMFWARYIGDEGYRDGWRGFVLALLFGYMESETYWMLLWRTLRHI